MLKKLEEKFVKEFGTLREIRGVGTPSGYLVFKSARLRVESSDPYDEGWACSLFQDSFSVNDLAWVIDRVEELFRLGLKDKEEEKKSIQKGFDKTKTFLEKGF